MPGTCPEGDDCDTCDSAEASDELGDEPLSDGYAFVIEEHVSCSNPSACPCECLECKRAWRLAGRPRAASGARHEHRD